MKQAMDVAKGDYSKGLDHNKIHYKCLVGLFEVMMKENQWVDAYDVVKRISRYFPANPQRLAQVLRLAIMTKNYDDIERYYQAFSTIDNRSDELIKYVCAALVVCGKFYLHGGHTSRALELFLKAAITANTRTKILREIVIALVDNGMAKDAKDYLNRFPAATQGSSDYAICDLLIMDRTVPATAVIQAGRKHLQAGIQDPMLYEILIKRSFAVGFKDAAENMIHEACKVFPDKKDTFMACAPAAGAAQTAPEDKKAAA